MKNLVIVESPTKARTIGKFLGNDYIIKASMGHIVDLPKSKLAVDVEHNFTPLYELVLDKKQIIEELKTAAKTADSIILATDPDREGEAIAAHVADMLRSSSKFKIQNSKFARIAFHEITKEAIENALRNPRTIDKNLVDAQTARRVLDRLVGYKLSPLLWKKIRRGLSAGRVQSVALRLIVEREREIEKFGKEKYWTISAFLSRQPRVSDDARLQNSENQSLDSASLSKSQHQTGTTPTFSSSESGLPPRNSTEFELIEINGEKIELQNSFQLYDGIYKITKTSIDSQEKALAIATDLKTKSFIVSDVLQKETKRSPAPPYTTSTLQQDAARRLGINGKRTMSLAQKLYEEGFITYHRTDSVTISSSAVFAIINFVKKEYGEKYVPEQPRIYSAKQKLAQEAHEAIRPTAVGQLLMIKDKVLSIVGQQGWRLYELIWRRAVASQMSDSIIESTTVMVDANSVIGSQFSGVSKQFVGDQSAGLKTDKLKTDGLGSENRQQKTGNRYKLKANGSVLVFDGFLKVNPLSLSDNRLPQFKVSEKLNLIDVLEKEHETLPPPRYNDASIIKTLEEKGIGRPSTYATIISTIESRQYILRDPPTGGGKFLPTAIGIAVNDFLVKNFSDIDDIPFTAGMEDSLDAIAHGQKEWVPVMRDFYTSFEKKLAEVEGAERVKIAVEQTDEKCPRCGKANLIVRTGKFGKFLACPRFPDCKFTKPYVEETGLACPKCKGKVVVKKTRKGRKFYGCSNYPACNYAAWRLEDIKKPSPEPAVKRSKQFA